MTAENLEYIDSMNAEAARSPWKVPFVDFGAQYAEEREQILACVENVFAEGVFVGHSHIQAFEEEAARLCGTSHAIGVSSGTDALFLALKVLGIGPGDEVITPPNSHFSSTSAIIHAGARPVFADVLDDQNIDPSAIAAAVTPRTKAIMPVHLTGRVAAMDEIMAVAEREGVYVVADAAQAAGANYNGRPAGSFGDMAAFSAHPLKVLNAAGDAGFLTTNNDGLAEQTRNIRNNGLVDRDTVRTWGYAARLDVLQAEILRTRIKTLSGKIARRRANVEKFRQLLNGDYVYWPPCKDQEFNIFQNFVVQVDTRDALKAHLECEGIRTSVQYPIPIHLQPAAADLGYSTGSMVVTERQAERILSLPVHPYLADWQIEYCAESINNFYGAPA